ncbi:hypothetical protein RF11_14405 [Thelohanellus kitauei]|uniref:Uncharacterized protein n=1 Tax=Thelohanellus kitauei TaxID=669202 RepID=A0A0C2MKT5_THEKT|nr:hypothetical protein RF11_14405 [Thelohanellus kitauei]
MPPVGTEQKKWHGNEVSWFSRSRRASSFSVTRISARCSTRARLPRTKRLPPRELYRHIRFPPVPTCTTSPQFPPTRKTCQLRGASRLRKVKQFDQLRILCLSLISSLMNLAFAKQLILADLPTCLKHSVRRVERQATLS